MIKLFTLAILALFLLNVKLDAAKTKDPFTVILDKRITWTTGKQGFDPQLPGYHVAGGIGKLTLLPNQRKLPDKLVLAIKTSTGMKPMLEHFSLVTSDLAIDSSLGNRYENLRRPQTKRPYDVFNLMPVGTYLRMEVVGEEVHVTLLPRAMKLLKQGATLSWIDWYRG